ncbi:MAG: SUMF1/EgtB/PvdO family nonheme iron enzyme [Chitinispirillia bacterium]|nr:SUMF1/EgtB/PvdO family nonheme iron enzyme [Chitinispirillia bacterium]MCL2268102.1 SUMF1/EgtB/PvdO family nonheme iron enzyme [Chitinispirillia bacterium]
MENEKSTNNNNDKPDGKKRGSGRFKAALVLLILLLLLLLLYLAARGSFGRDAGVDLSDIDTAEVVDTVPADTFGVDAYGINMPGADTAVYAAGIDLDSLARARALADSLARLRADSLARARAIADSLARLRAIADSLALLDSLRIADSLARLRFIADSLARLDSLRMADSLARRRADSLRIADSLARIVDPCLRDTLAPWVTPDPTGGLHRRAVDVKLIPNKHDCVIEWKIDGAGSWRVYDGQPITINKNAVLHYRAADKCGRRMEARSKRYTFDMADVSGRCPPDMELVSVDGREFCVDAYQWPNKRGVTPQAFVSLYQAMDSCFSVRKRLCTSDEWTTACAGPDKWTYLYGSSYEVNACVTRDSIAQRSGSRPECRGYYAVFDMSGNLGEWTSTPASQDRSFNNVMGGFWSSGSQSRCADARYSYFPQNRHNPVGFRCCRDAAAPPQRGGR